jgi:hypothetical protein
MTQASNETTGKGKGNDTNTNTNTKEKEKAMAKRKTIRTAKVNYVLQGKNMVFTFTSLSEKVFKSTKAYYDETWTLKNGKFHFNGKIQLGHVLDELSQNENNTRIRGAIEKSVFPDLTNIERSNFKKMYKLSVNSSIDFVGWKNRNFPKLHSETAILNKWRKFDAACKFVQTENFMDFIDETNLDMTTINKKKHKDMMYLMEVFNDWQQAAHETESESKSETEADTETGNKKNLESAGNGSDLETHAVDDLVKIVTETLGALTTKINKGQFKPGGLADDLDRVLNAFYVKFQSIRPEENIKRAA